MARGVNKVILIGNLGADPEINHTPNGTKVARIRIATTESYKDKNGEWKEETEWHNVVLWQYLADNTEKHLKKGSKVYIEGKLKNRSYEKDGSKKFFTEVLALSMILLDQKSSEMTIESSSYSQEKKEDYPITSNESFSHDNSSNNDDDIPF